jgi:ATP-binding cassette subfamily C protein CydD
VGAGFLAAALLAAQAWLLAGIIDPVFLQRQTRAEQLAALAALVILATMRATLLWLGDVSAQQSAGHVTRRLRGALAAHVPALGPAYTRTERSGELVSTSAGGIEALDEYVTRFLPARYLAAMVPVFVFGVIFLDRGRAVETGSHDTLLAHGALYPRLVATTQGAG